MLCYWCSTCVCFEVYVCDYQDQAVMRNCTEHKLCLHSPQLTVCINTSPLPCATRRGWNEQFICIILWNSFLRCLPCCHQWCQEWWCPPVCQLHLYNLQGRYACLLSLSVPTVLVKYRCSHTVSSGRISVMNTLQSGKMHQIRINTIFIIALINMSRAIVAEQSCLISLNVFQGTICLFLYSSTLYIRFCFATVHF